MDELFLLDSLVYRTGDAGIISPHQHLRQQFYHLVALSLLDAPSSQRLKVMEDIGVILAGGNDTVGLANPTVRIKMQAVIEDAPWHLHRPDPDPGLRLDGLPWLLPGGVQKLINQCG